MYDIIIGSLKKPVRMYGTENTRIPAKDKLYQKIEELMIEERTVKKGRIEPIILNKQIKKVMKSDLKCFEDLPT